MPAEPTYGRAYRIPPSGIVHLDKRFREYAAVLPEGA